MPLKFMRRIPGSGDNRRNKDDPDYEEVGPVTIHLKHTPDGRGDGKHCEVCGSAQAVVRCANCSGQVFCEACDQVFHRHPRRTQHCRKAMEGVRPPLPPKAVEGGKDIPPPQPPPRRNKRSFLGGTNLRKDQSGSTEGPLSEGGEGARTTIMSSLKRFMGSRPLPAPPSAATRGQSAGGGTLHSNLIRSLTSPDLANDENEPALAVAIPQTVVDLTHEDQHRGDRPPAYPPLPRPPASSAGVVDAQNKINSAGHQRKLSLQQASLQREEKRQSMIDVGASWDSSANRHRSQSVSEEQWTQLMQSKTSTPQSVPSTPPIQEPPPINRSRFNSAVSAGGRVPSNVPTRGGRGMTSSTSVCDLNTLSQQQVLPPSQAVHPHQLVPRMGGMHPSGSFQQLNLVPYSGGMIWAPAPCDMCHGPAPMYPPPLPSQGMKRAASNLSMNMSSASSDVSGYPWQPPHMHHHMPHPMYPGYYPPPPGPHLIQGSMQGSTISIPDSMAVFSKVSSSPATSVRSSSKRSHKSNKSRSFSQADISRRTRSSHRSDSDETTSTSPSGDDDILNNSKPSYVGGILAWQCDHCTFINQAGSRVCGMCSKTQASTAYHRSSKRATERRRSEQRRFGCRRNDQEDDDRDQSDFENEGKHNNHQTHTNGREHRRDRSSKLSTTSRSNSKKKHRRRAGSSGSASDVVDELERQLSDIKVSKSRTADFDGLSTRYKERERERDRERGTRRREGLSGRIKSRSKNASERSRTPGRPSPDSQSTHSSPRDPSPADDEVFEHEQTDDKKKENTNNSHSNDGTLLGPVNSDETILATEQIVVPVESNNFRQVKSVHNSTGSTPEPIVEIQHAEVQVLPSIEAVEVLPEPKQSPHLDLPKRKEKSPSPFHLEVEEISFANTLDDVVTMGTNEVADIDPSLDERPFSALPPIEEPQVEIPCVQYVEPILSHEELMETALLSEHENPAVERANSSSIKLEEIGEQFDDGERVNNVQAQQQTTEPEISEENKQGDLEDSQIELSDRVEDNLGTNKKRAVQEQNHRKELNDISEAIIGEAKERENFVKSSHQDNPPRHHQQDARPHVHHQDRSPSNGSVEDVLGRPASSLESSPGFNRAFRDRQYTPLSFSSSDAAFYSPADSQDDSADERTRSRPVAPRQTMQTVIVAAGDEELVTALESLKSTEDRRSSRETIKSSVDDLPYSPDDTGGETSDASFASPLDETLRHPDDHDNGGPSGLRPTSPEGGYVSSDVYEGLTFQDALSGQADVRPLQKSASDQMLLKGQRKPTEEQSPKMGRRAVTDIDDRFLTVDEMITKRQQEAMKRDGLELVQVLRDAEKAGYRAEEVSAALPVCGDKGPLAWLMDNWWQMVQTVITLASTYGREKKENNFGQISEEEARAALRTHKGDIWAAVTESVEQRQSKFAELTARGSFPAALVAEALQRNAGDLEAAYAELLHMRAHSAAAGADERQKIHEDTLEVNSRTNLQNPSAEDSRDQEKHQDEDTSIYSNLVSTNANLVSKTEALMQEIEEEAPMLSKELKLKIVRAILDEDPSIDDDRPHIDSDEESTIEELLAREQNPTFYEYFTAVDLDEDGESRRGGDAEEDAGSHFYSADNASEHFFETGPSSNAASPGVNKTGESVISDYDAAEASCGQSAEEMLYVRKEDVTVHPLRTYQNFTNLSGLQFEEAEEKSFTAATVVASQQVASPSPAASKLDRKLTKSVNVPQPHTKSVEDSDKTSGIPVDNANSGVTLRQKKSPPQGADDIKQETRSSVTYESSSSGEEDESVSVTTGRLSLSLSHTSDKEGNIDVTAATVENERIQTDLSPRVRSPATSKTAGRPNFASIRQTDIRHIAQLEELENSAKAAVTQSPDRASETGPHSTAVGGVVMETTATSAPQQESLVKQEPVKKASSIIGKAIAKAMARESSVRDGTPPVHSPEPEESSRGSTPASYTQESTAASSMLDSDGSTPVSTTPMSMTPRSTPDLQEEQSQGVGRGEGDSEDDDLLRSLDTIPEEEEMSERTESGRGQSRSSARNFKLPFNATSIVRLLTPTLLRGKDKSQKLSSSPEPTKIEQKYPTSDSSPKISNLSTPSEATSPVEMSASQQAESLELGPDSDLYQETKISEKSDGSDSPTPHFAEDDGEDNSLSLIPPSTSDVMHEVEWTSSVTEDAKLEQASKSSHHYYNDGVEPPGNMYYNDSAMRTAPEHDNDETIRVDPNDYESMYSIKRDLDSLRESSSQVSEKIESLGMKRRNYGPIKQPSEVKNLAPSPKMLSPKVTKKLTTPDVEAAESRLQEQDQETDDPPISGAQLLAEEHTNTVKRSPKSTGKKIKEDGTKETSGKTDGSDNESKTEKVRGSNSQDKIYGTISTKPKVAKNSKSTHKNKPAASGSESNSSSEVSSVNKKPGASTSSKSIIKRTLKESSASDSNESSSLLTVKPSAPGSSLLKKAEPSAIGGGSSALSVAETQNDDSIQSKTKEEPSQAKFEDDSAQNKPREDFPQTKPQDDSSQVKSEEDSEDSDDEGAVVQGLEDMRGREPQYSEVVDLKQQVTDIKRSLQSQMEGEEEAATPEAQGEASGAPVITIQEPDGGGGEAPVKRRTAAEDTEYEQLRFDRTVRRLLAEGQAGSYEKAELAAHLLTLSFDEEDSVAAAQECSSIYGALHFLQQECELCAEKYPMRKMVSMLYCTHSCCTDCARTYFTFQIKTKNIREMRCPFCNEPNLDTAEESTAEYFNHLDILLKGIVDEETHELFQRKLRDLTLMSDPNFRWCNKCSSGFIANPRARKLICPDCRDITCAHCRLPWEMQHEGISCDAFAKWKQENDPEAQAQGVARHLAENGITCPKCRFQYSLAKGGCMHFTCSECKYEFCSGCGQPFRQGARCPVGPYCERLGLHAHHPRNCLFYLRDKDPPQLQQLLKENNIPFDTEPTDEDGQTEDGGGKKQCHVAEQKETPDGLVDDICGRSVLQGHAGLCRLHYVEYLVEKINSHHLDPVIIFDEADLRVCLRRNGKSVPVRRWESEKLYRDKLIKLIKEQLPL